LALDWGFEACIETSADTEGVVTMSAVRIEIRSNSAFRCFTLVIDGHEFGQG